MPWIKRYGWLLVFFCSCLLLGQPAFSQPKTNTRVWLRSNLDFYLHKLNQNISPQDGAPGSVLAAPSRDNPDYYYHWVRDAALAMDALITVYPTVDTQQKNSIRETIFHYLDFSARLQNAQTMSGLGEPKFYVNGSVFNQPWGRPQNDSAALRAISLIHWAKILLAQGEATIVTEKMYDVALPAKLPIKKDLEYISHHWREATYDLWEEVKGQHFYTLMVERRAMLEGAALAHRLQDDGAAQWYWQQSQEMAGLLVKFWDPKQGYLRATLNRSDGLDYKYSNLDSSVVLGLLHGDMNDGFFSWDDPRVVATLQKILEVFAELYPINHHPNIPGIAIGRYPEDRYAGVDFSGGNPWPLCTLAIAEAYYRYASLLIHQGNKEKALAIARTADQMVERVRYHAHLDGSLNEQMNRDSGFMTSAPNLTWNYAALLSTRQVMLNLDLMNLR